MLAHVQPAAVGGARAGGCAPSRRRYLKSSFLMNSTMMSLSGWICSILRMRHMKWVGLDGSPYMPPTWVGQAVDQCSLGERATQPSSRQQVTPHQAARKRTSRQNRAATVSSGACC